jgi:hypothetical protein
MRDLILGVFMVCSLPTWAVELRLHGQVTDHSARTPLTEVLVRVYRNGVKERAFTTGPGGRYTVELERGGNYIIRFSLPGHITKCYAGGYERCCMARRSPRGFRGCGNDHVRERD